MLKNNIISKSYLFALASATVLYISSCTNNKLVNEENIKSDLNLEQIKKTELSKEINLDSIYLDLKQTKNFDTGLFFAINEIRKENKKLIPDTLYSTLLINEKDTINYYLIYRKDENINKHFPIINFYTKTHTNPEDVTNAITYKKFDEGIKVIISHMNQVNLKYTEPNYFSKNKEKYSKYKDAINDVESYIVANIDTTRTKEQVFEETNNQVNIDLNNLSNVLIKYITDFSKEKNKK
jgi:hypothetical protein